MRASAFLLTLTFASLVAAAPVPPPQAREAAQLVEKLGSDDFREREAATKRLEELGALALDELRGACKSENPEIADRAKDLVRKIERRLASDQLLTPTQVELDVKNTALDDVLAALSKQAGYEVVVGGLKSEDVAARKITVATAGKVPFWTAVQKICDAADLQVANVGGFIAPGAMPYHSRSHKRPGGKLRVAENLELAVVLESRGGAKNKPMSVHGAVLVEAFPLPKEVIPFVTSGTTLQVWPEPRLVWQSVTHVGGAKAVDRDGRKLLPAPATPPSSQVLAYNRPLGTKPIYTPMNQAYLTFKSPEAGASELTGTIYGMVRSAPEPVATITLAQKPAGAVTGAAGVEMTASTRTDANGKKFVDVKLIFSPTAVDAVRPSDPLPGEKLDATGSNRSVLGVRVTDADGAAFALAVANQQSGFDRNGRRVIIVQLTLELILAKDGPTTPAKVIFWGTIAKPVEVPFVLKDVPFK